jgi:hypothetical protein
MEKVKITPDDFNQPQEQSGIVPEFNDFAVQTQLGNICKLLDGKASHYTCMDSRGMQYQKIVITYDHKEK